MKFGYPKNQQRLISEIKKAHKAIARKRFAWIPIKLPSDEYIWLESYYKIQYLPDVHFRDMIKCGATKIEFYNLAVMVDRADKSRATCNLRDIGKSSFLYCCHGVYEKFSDTSISSYTTEQNYNEAIKKYIWFLEDYLRELKLKAENDKSNNK